MTRWHFSFAAWVVAATLVLGSAAQLLAAAGNAYAVRYESGKLWMDAHEAPAADLLKVVAQKTGVRFVVDSEVNPGPITLSLDGMPLERAVRNLVTAIPHAAGHTMTYAPAKRGGTRLIQVTLFGPGKATAGKASAVYGESTTPIGDDNLTPEALPTPNLEDRMQKMIDAGVPRDTAEKVITLTREVQKLQKTPKPGSYRPEDLSPDSRAKLQPLIERGVPMERAVQMLLLQERYQATLTDLQKVPGGPPPAAVAESPPEPE